jgi:tRNA (cytidine/uridine-2'-O-)-methyltransferase
LDYHAYATLRRHRDWQTFLDTERPAPDRLFTLTTRGTRNLFDTAFQPGDWLVFGSETKGISDAVRACFGPGQSLKLPMQKDQRSLNLSNAVAVTVFEAWRQNGFA